MRKVLLIIFGLAFIVSAGYLIYYYMSAHEAADHIEDLKELIVERDANGSGDVAAPTKDFTKLYKKNNDFIGWLTIKGTPIDYPVMQTKDENEFYLHRNFDRDYDANGLPFLDANCDLNKPSTNLMIYGHHMKSGMMFASLLNFEKKEYYNKHKKITLDTLNDSREYEIIAAFYSQVYAKDSKEFKFYQFFEADTKKDFEDYISGVKKLSLYDTGITPQLGDELVTLVTCSYHVENGRFAVVGRRIK